MYSDVFPLYYYHLPVVLFLLLTHHGLQFLNTFVTSGNFLIQLSVLLFKLLNFTTPPKRTYLCYDGGFCFGLDCFQLLRSYFFLYLF